MVELLFSCLVAFFYFFFDPLYKKYKINIFFIKLFHNIYWLISSFGFIYKTNSSYKCYCALTMLSPPSFNIDWTTTFQLRGKSNKEWGNYGRNVPLSGRKITQVTQSRCSYFVLTEVSFLCNSPILLLSTSLATILSHWYLLILMTQNRSKKITKLIYIQL